MLGIRTSRGTSSSALVSTAGPTGATTSGSGWCAADSDFGRVAALFFRVEVRGEGLKAKARPRDGVLTPSQRLLLPPVEIDRAARAAQTLRTGHDAPSGCDRVAPNSAAYSEE